jgi:hypothetical protein
MPRTVSRDAAELRLRIRITGSKIAAVVAENPN